MPKSAISRSFSCLLAVGTLFLFACGGGGHAAATGSTASASENNAVLAQRGCNQGGSAEEVAEAARRQVPGRHPFPPQAALATASSSECGSIVESTPPWYDSVVDPGLGVAADYKVKVRQGEPLMVAFGAPIRSARAYLGPSHGCGIRLIETGDPSLFEVSLPARIWTNPSKGCGRRGKVAGSIDAVYGEGSPFVGYSSQVAFSFALAS